MLLNIRPWRRWSRFLCVLALLSAAGCQKFSMLRSQNPDDDDESKVQETVFIADQVTVFGLHTVQVETVGIVTGLDNTGGDSSPSLWRTMAVDEMRRRGVKNPNTVLNSPDTALVIVRAALPPVIEIDDHFDVEVVLPENSTATSLKGGWLLDCSLSEQAIVPGKAPMKGHVLARAEGPIMLSTGEGDSASMAGVLKRGRILGGGVYKGGLLKESRDMGLYLRNDLRSVRQSKRIASTIGKRFHSFEHGLKKPLATAKTDQKIELKIHPRYKDNFVRYVQVIRHIAINETEVEKRERMERLRKSLLVPQTAGNSAMELEAIGHDSILILKEGLKSQSAEVRFYSADALAYLGDSSGAQVLAEAARNEDAFRVFALAALATLDDTVTRDLLKDLMTEPTIEIKDGERHEVWSAETCFGAYRTLHTIDKDDSFIRGEPMHKGEFQLHVLKSEGEPMVHLSMHRSPEIVLFNDDQRLRTPISLSAGRHILVTAPAGSDKVTVSRFEAGLDNDRQIVCGTKVADVIRAVSKLDASYPDVAQMLVQAENQANIDGRLQLDALPQAGRIYRRPASDIPGPDGRIASTQSTTRVGKPNLVPNLFPAIDQKGDAGLDDDDGDDDKGTDDSDDSKKSDVETTDTNSKSAEPAKSGESGEASIADVSETSESSGKRGNAFTNFFKGR
jgi:flagellar basal body P-ring protein FlgI